MISSAGCFAIAAFLVMGWIELSIRGRFAGRALDRIGMVWFTVAGVYLAAVSIFGLLKQRARFTGLRLIGPPFTAGKRRTK
jgi:hypothetical protein